MPDYYNYRANQNRNQSSDNNGLLSWLVIIVALAVFWPVGLVLLFRKLMGRPSLRTATRHPYDLQREAAAGQRQKEPPRRAEQAQTAGGQAGAQYSYDYTDAYAGKQGKKNKKKQKKKDGLPTGRGLTIWGGIVAAIGAILSINILSDAFWYGLYSYDVVPLVMCTGMLGAGLVMAYCGLTRGKKAKRFRKYLALIGRRESISITALAQAMPATYRAACADLQDMLDGGYLPTGYIDAQSGRLILSDEGIEDAWEEPKKAEPTPEEKLDRDDEILLEIRRINDAIADVEMSRKIDRIGEITGKILAYQRNNPGKANQLSSFLSYYLPTTLKILRAYAQLEAQGIEGENITAAKVRIEGMMDKVVEGFEKQLDRLFQNDAMDITTDIAVLEKMIDSDGLSNRQGLQI